AEIERSKSVDCRSLTYEAYRMLETGLGNVLYSKVAEFALFVSSPWDNSAASSLPGGCKNKELTHVCAFPAHSTTSTESSEVTNLRGIAGPHSISVNCWLGRLVLNRFAFLGWPAGCLHAARANS